MQTKPNKHIPEIILAYTMAALVLAICFWKGFALIIPNTESLAFLSIHYLSPFILVIAGFVLLGLPRLLGKTHRSNVSGLTSDAFNIVFYLLIFTAVIYFHFHIKLWMPLINPANYDALYYQTDGYLRPLVNGAFQIRAFTVNLLGNLDLFYHHIFVLMFVVSFVLHYVFDRKNFRSVFFSSLLVLSLGSVAYLIAPALGPFIYEPGANSLLTTAEADMLRVHQDVLRFGVPYVNERGPSIFIIGLAAMPSLHIANAWIFLQHAFRGLPLIFPTYVLIFSWLVIEAVASRFHYVIDLPIGLLLAVACISIANRCVGVVEPSKEALSLEKAPAASRILV